MHRVCSHTHRSTLTEPPDPSWDSPYPEDAFGEEMGRDARIWKVYANQAPKQDEEMLRAWNQSLDTLLIFVRSFRAVSQNTYKTLTQAGLFSAVSTAFIIESYKTMQPDFTELTFLAIRALANGTQTPALPPFVVSITARAVNCLWISSLLTSLLAALVGILAKQWLASWTVSGGDDLREWSKQRQYRYDALHKWQVPEIIAFLPALLHASLLLFCAGLVLFLRSIDGPTTLVALILSVAIYAVYTLLTIGPLARADCPYRTQLTPQLQRLLRILARLLSIRIPASLRKSAWDTVPNSYQAQVFESALSWLEKSSMSLDVYRAIIRALGDLRFGTRVGPLVSMRLRQRIFSDMRQMDVRYCERARVLLYLRAALPLPSPGPPVPGITRAVESGLQSNDERELLVNEFAAWTLSISFINGEEFQEGQLIALSITARSGALTGSDFREALIQHVHRPISDATCHQVLRGLEVPFIEHQDGLFGWNGDVSTMLRVLHGYRTHFARSFKSSNRIARLILEHVPAHLMPPQFQRLHDSWKDLSFGQVEDMQPAHCNLIEVLSLVAGEPEELGLDSAQWSTLVDDIVFFIREHSESDCSSQGHESIYRFFLDREQVEGHAWTCREIFNLLHVAPKDISRLLARTNGSLTIQDVACALCNILQPGLSWYSDPTVFESYTHDALDTCRDRVMDAIVFGGPASLDLFLTDAALLPLTADTHVDIGNNIHFRSLSGGRLGALVKITAGVLGVLRDTGGFRIDALIEKLFYSRESNPGDASAAREWDLVRLCQAKLGFNSLDSIELSVLCDGLTRLHRLDPDRPQWRELGEMFQRALTPDVCFRLRRVRLC